jgi:uncharacterized damage-inducible protein DinB
MRIVDPILMELEQETQTTRRVLERVPNDKLAWRPCPSARTLGQLALHIARTPGIFADFVSRPTLALPPAPGVDSDPSSTGEVLTALEGSVASARTVLGGMDDATAMSAWTLTRDGATILSVPRIGVVRSLMLNHWYHHRGQLSVYLRELGVAVPSIYGPSGDENPFAPSAPES